MFKSSTLQGTMIMAIMTVYHDQNLAIQQLLNRGVRDGLSLHSLLPFQCFSGCQAVGHLARFDNRNNTLIPINFGQISTNPAWSTTSFIALNNSSREVYETDRPFIRCRCFQRFSGCHAVAHSARLDNNNNTSNPSPASAPLCTSMPRRRLALVAD